MQTNRPDEWTPPSWGQQGLPPGYTVKIERPRRHIFRWVFLGIAAVIAVAVIASAASGGGSSGAAPANSKIGSGTAAHPAASDITLSGCTVDDIGVPQALATITNHSSKASDYMFQVNFMNSAGVVVGQGYGASNNIAAGQSAQEKIVGLTTDAHLPLTCQTVDVSRLAS